jgi:hypothetical protein
MYPICYEWTMWEREPSVCFLLYGSGPLRCKSILSLSNESELTLTETTYIGLSKAVHMPPASFHRMAISWSRDPGYGHSGRSAVPPGMVKYPSLTWYRISWDISLSYEWNLCFATWDFVHRNLWEIRCSRIYLLMFLLARRFLSVI